LKQPASAYRHKGNLEEFLPILGLEKIHSVSPNDVEGISSQVVNYLALCYRFTQIFDEYLPMLHVP